MSPQSDPLHRLAALISGQAPAHSLLNPTSDTEPTGIDAGLIQAAVRHGVGPLLLWRRQQEGLPAIGAAAPAALAQLAEERNRAAVHFMLATTAQAQLQAALDAAAIDCIWLKGIVLAQTVYPAPELRPMADVDVLVPYAQREQALAVARALGYAQEMPLLFDGSETLKHHYHLAAQALRPLRLEIHFRLLGVIDRILTVEELAWFWHYSIETSRAGVRFPILAPEAHLLYLCAHAMLQHGEADFKLLRFYDLHCLATQTPDLDWALVVRGAAHLRWTYAAERALSLAQEYFATPLPQGLLAELAAARPPHEVTAHVTRRQLPRSTSETVLHDLAMMGWRDRVRTLFGIVLPPAEYMRRRYALRAGRQLPGAYLRRWGHMAQDAARVLQRNLRRRWQRKDCSSREL